VPGDEILGQPTGEFSGFQLPGNGLMHIEIHRSLHPRDNAAGRPMVPQRNILAPWRERQHG
jgi:hypothetical protein